MINSSHNKQNLTNLKSLNNKRSILTSLKDSPFIRNKTLYPQILTTGGIKHENRQVNNNYVQEGNPPAYYINKMYDYNLAEVTPKGSLHMQSLNSGGRSLPETEQNFFEPRFGADFSKVRIHTDPKSNYLAKSLGAKAFTIQKHIVFDSGRYSPHTVSGRQLLAHELAHTLQPGNNQIIRRWEDIYHEAMTKSIGKRLNFKSGFLNSVAFYNIRQDKIPYDPPDHGECAHRSNLHRIIICRDKKTAKIRNLNRQNKYLKAAINSQNMYNNYKNYKVNRLAGIYEKILGGFIGEVHHYLGGALHVAQDRGAHGEGAPGYGHSSSLGNKCDIPKYNISGWREAGRNTYKVFNDFDQGITGAKDYKNQGPMIPSISPVVYSTGGFTFSNKLVFHRLSLIPRYFHISNGRNVTISCTGQYSLPGLRTGRYHITLFHVLHGYNFNKGTKSYRTGRRESKVWRNLPAGEYFLRIEKGGSIWGKFIKELTVHGRVSIR